MRIAVIGSNGQVGTDVVSAARRAGCDVIALTHDQCEVIDRASLDLCLQSVGPGDAVVNTAAFHRSDECEDHPDRAMDVNAIGALNAAAAARGRGASIAFTSTDYVFDGTKGTAYVENDVACPINSYGVSKLAGEMLVSGQNPAHYIVRISGVFGVAGSSGKGGNFVETMLGKARRGERIQVVDDIIMSPTFAADAAELLVALLTKRVPAGIYHLANAGSCSWNEFANAILGLAGFGEIAQPIPSSATVSKTTRPPDSSLRSERLGAHGLQARPWRDALGRYLLAKGHVGGTRAVTT